MKHWLLLALLVLAIGCVEDSSSGINYTKTEETETITSIPETENFTFEKNETIEPQCFSHSNCSVTEACVENQCVEVGTHDIAVEKVFCKPGMKGISFAIVNKGITPMVAYMDVLQGKTIATLTEEELIQFLRIPEISSSNNYHNVIEHLKRFRDLPRMHICNKTLYPKKAILDWIEKETSR